ncbi:hypothetical protein [Nonlabens antarcticus]|uniref:hypothetical protein n=1 Tax=Nonlabens antarcticus TaxID=392714 RepID=UPI001891B79C|nr:hypothetical protein [Nonlabens antarcticus]
MKIILSALIAVSVMLNTKFEKMIGKHISIFEKATCCDFENKLFGKDFYYLDSSLKEKEYFTMNYNTLSVVVDENSTINSITIHFRNVLDKEFYNVFVEYYGAPDSIQTIKNKNVSSRSSYTDPDDNLSQYLTKSTFDLREGKFDENPLYIIWKKKNYQMRAFLRHNQNLSEITFSSNQ